MKLDEIALFSGLSRNSTNFLAFSGSLAPVGTATLSIQPVTPSLGNTNLTSGLASRALAASPFQAWWIQVSPEPCRSMMPSEL